MRQIKLARRLTIEQDLALRDPVAQQARESEYDPEYFFHSRDGDVKVLKEDGSVLLWVVHNSFQKEDCQRAYEHLKNVKGDPTSRPETVGSKREFRRRADGTLSNQFRAPAEKVQEYKKKGPRPMFSATSIGLAAFHTVASRRGRLNILTFFRIVGH